MNQLVREAIHEFGEEREVGCIVSIGTGIPKVNKYEKPGLGSQRILPTDLIEVVKKIATDSENEASRVKKRYRNFHGLYHRLNVPQGLEDIGLEEWKKVGEVRTHTRAYLNDDEISQDLDEIAKSMIGRSSRMYTLGHLGI